MSDNDNARFRLAFPVIRLPEHYGGKRAIVMFSVSQPSQPGVAFACCVDEAGNVFQNVPVRFQDLVEAGRKPTVFVEAPDESIAAKVSGLVSPSGRLI